MVRVETGIKAEVKAAPMRTHTQDLEKQKQAGFARREGGLTEGGGGDTAVDSASTFAPMTKKCFWCPPKVSSLKRGAAKGSKGGRRLVVSV